MHENPLNQIHALVEKLNDLSENQRVILEILSHGADAIGPLAGFLLSGPQLHPEPRCLAAEALGLIGGPDAVEALCDVLFVNDVREADPSVRLSEEVVRNRAAEELGRLGDPSATEPLLAALQRFHLAGAAEALGRLKVRRAIPFLIELLEDDFGRERASEALMSFGREVTGDLAKTLHVKKMAFDAETAQSVNRRVTAIRLLADLADRSIAGELCALLSDEAPKVRRQAALALAKLGGKREQTAAAKVLEALLSDPDWMVQEECREALSLIASENSRPGRFQKSRGDMKRPSRETRDPAPIEGILG
jgi:HEAT repeat protein